MTNKQLLERISDDLDTFMDRGNKPPHIVVARESVRRELEELNDTVELMNIMTDVLTEQDEENYDDYEDDPLG